MAFSRRWEGHVPNKGYRVQPPIPDHLKDSINLFGNRNGIAGGGEAPLPAEGTGHLVQKVLSSGSHIKNYNKLDRLRIAMNRAREELPEHPTWQEVYMFFRTTEMCTEVRVEAGDVFPKGQKLWIELEACEEKRVPNLLEMPNGLLVLPVFTVEETIDHYFSRNDIFESCWFPVPRMGTRWEPFCALPFPACVIGTLEHFSTLATVALPHQFAILINPGQYSSKFITYPEMVRLSQIKKTPLMKRELTLVKEKDGKKDLIVDEHLITLFDTRKMTLKRVEPHEVEEKMRGRPQIPPIAQLELHLLLFKYPEIEKVYVRKVERPRWRTMIGVPEILTEIDIISSPKNKPPEKFLQHLKRWSYMKEFLMDVHIELTTEIPESSGDSIPMCIYTSEDGNFLRSMYTYKKEHLTRNIGYHEPILDELGRKPYEGYNYFDM
ncbi:unnamed protein product [Phytomonas sp. Hart1]|nr:unnamed protein product [Phytomonas sp. Hart1]|eukprot:CCW68922.1 unnamed protein product [Phytomonas sp. isolate Hart1]